MSLVVLQPGLHATVQDRGRVGWRAYGVPVGGAFDLASYGLANALVGNDPDEDAAALELTLFGGVFRADSTLAVALAGAPLQARVEGPDGTYEVAIPGSLTLRAGDRLVLGGIERGTRTYLAVAGGWQTPRVLGSRSVEQPLRAGDRLEARPARIPRRRPADLAGGILGEGVTILRAIDGPDLAGRPPAQHPWDGLVYRVDARSDRMGVRLDGPALAVPAEPERLSAPVAPGAIQVAGGRPLILGVACGTMGGYPHVGHVIAADLPRLAQARPGSSIQFRRLSLEEARCIDREDRSTRRALLRAIAALARDGRQFDPAD